MLIVLQKVSSTGFADARAMMLWNSRFSLAKAMASLPIFARRSIDASSAWKSSSVACSAASRTRAGSIERKSGGEGKRGSVQVELGGRRIIKKKNNTHKRKN